MHAHREPQHQMVNAPYTSSSKLTWRDVQYLIAYTSDQSRLVGGDARVQFGF